MNIKKIILYMTTALLTACSSAQEGETGSDTVAEVAARHGLRIRVTDGMAATRASIGHNLGVTFQTGDAIGIYVMNGSSAVSGMENVKVTYQATTGEWVPEKDILYSSSYTYYAYYPYDGNMSPSAHTDKTAATATDFFAPYQRLYNFWHADQSTLQKLMACDFMVAQGAVTEGATANEGSILFTMEHKMALFQLELNDKPDVRRTANLSVITYRTQNGYEWTVTRNTPVVENVSLSASETFTGSNLPYRYSTEGGISRYFYIGKPGTDTPFATSGDGGWTLTLNAPSGRYIHRQVTADADAFTVETITESRSYTLATGDFLGNDGSIWKTSNNASRGDGATAVGIVFNVGYEGYEGQWTHGLAVGLRDAEYSGSKQMMWAQDMTVTSTVSVLSPRWTTMSTLDAYHFIVNETGYVTTGQNGYANTRALNSVIAQLNNDDIAPAFKALSLYPLAAPTNSSGWFMPSISELHMLCLTLGGLSLAPMHNESWGDSEAHAFGCYYYYPSLSVAGNINGYLSTVGGTAGTDYDPISMDTNASNAPYYWASTEYKWDNIDNNPPFRCVFSHDHGGLYFERNYDKWSAAGRVRPVIAF